MGVTFAPLCIIQVSWRARASERRAPALFSSPAVARISGTLAWVFDVPWFLMAMELLLRIWILSTSAVAGLM
jgi:hypothetical protein